jgi:hypothetical protein
LEFAKAARESALLAEKTVTLELQTAEQMLAVTKDAVSETEEAAAQLTNADNAEESAQRNVRGADHEIQYRHQLLHEIDRPDLRA